MTRLISLEPHLAIDELEGRYRSAKDPVERSRWRFLWLLARGLTAKAVSSITGYSAYWIGRIAQRYNQQSPDGGQRPPASVATEQQPTLERGAAGLKSWWRPWQQALRLKVSAGVGGRSPPGSASVLVAASAVNSAGSICAVSGPRLLMPRPRHVQADSQAQAVYNDVSRPGISYQRGS